MPKAKSSSAYKGTVTVKIKNKNKVKKSFKGRNTGTQNLFRAIALALAGYQVGNNVPTYMCVAPQLIENGEGQEKPDYAQSSTPISVTGRSYGQDSQLDWFCRTTATLPKSSFRQSWGANQTYYAILLNGVQTQTVEESRNVLAYIKLQTEDETPLDLQSMAQGTSLLIEWDLYVQNYDVVKDRVEGGNE